jgi:hypothetical protein
MACGDHSFSAWIGSATLQHLSNVERFPNAILTGISLIEQIE